MPVLRAARCFSREGSGATRQRQCFSRAVEAQGRDGVLAAESVEAHEGKGGVVSRAVKAQGKKQCRYQHVRRAELIKRVPRDVAGRVLWVQKGTVLKQESPHFLEVLLSFHTCIEWIWSQSSRAARGGRGTIGTRMSNVSSCAVLPASGPSLPETRIWSWPSAIPVQDEAAGLKAREGKGGVLRREGRGNTQGKGTRQRAVS